jgi:anti-sigma regulatory factor (Ser/Thr protein kinase)
VAATPGHAILLSMTVSGDEATPEETTPAQLPEDAIVANAVVARTINEAIREGCRDESAPANFICECGALGCQSIVELAPGDYESVRADPRRFVIAPRHERPQDEIVATTGRYVVVAKLGAAAVLAERADPRALAPAPALYRVPTVSFTFPAIPEAVPRARHCVGEFVEAHARDNALRGRVLLAFSEAFTNAVVHAYADPDSGDIEVAADVEDHTLEIVVIDHGRGLTRSQADGLGAGLSIVARSTDAFAIRERTPTGTEVWLRFGLDQTPHPSRR